jgi:glyoxylase-like metal-dependent hydrolase (beta-lactamase superfamily II)
LVSLAAAGYQPQQIDDILITHIHTDHSGGLVEGDRLAFPNATIHVGKPDVDFFLNPANATASGYDRKYFDEAAKTIGPYIRAGKVKTFTGRTEILPGVTAIPTPGHTPGHSFYLIESRGQQIEMIGDIAHVTSVQFPQPRITIVYDVDHAAAASQRAKQFAAAASERRLVAAAHFPFPGIGHIRAEATGYTWVPVDYIDRDER